MKTIRIFGTRGLILATALGVSVGVACPAFAQTLSPVIVNPDGKITYLGTLGGFQSDAQAINNSGQVTGNYSETGLDEHGWEFIYGRAFITGPNGMGMKDLGVLLTGSHVYASAHAYGINDSGQAVGESNPDGYGHAFITGPDGMGMRDLGTLDGFQSEAHGINDAGQVVGVSYSADGSRQAFITGSNGMGMTDLNSIVNLPDGSHLSDVQGINNQGQVIATVTTIPEPASYVLMLAGLVLVGLMARGKKQVAQVSYTPAPV